MKARIAILAGAAAAVLTGCVVTSVCPYYTQKDLVSEPAILGNWINQKNTNEVWKFEQSGDLVYRFTLTEPQKATVMEARTFKLRGQLFMDVFSLEDDFHVIPAHYLLRVTEVAPALRMSELSQEWMASLLAKDDSAVRHHFVKTGDKPEDRRLVLTANTPELQKFVIKHLGSKEAWKDSFELRREPVPVNTAQAKNQ